ncbi:hypothetical protein HDU86_000901 [Geranomyces michiganensis]|nr:hypothetical protein HDU86_000901 [Geranomyces michiganensis]
MIRFDMLKAIMCSIPRCLIGTPSHIFNLDDLDYEPPKMETYEWIRQREDVTDDIKCKLPPLRALSQSHAKVVQLSMIKKLKFDYDRKGLRTQMLEAIKTLDTQIMTKLLDEDDQLIELSDLGKHKRSMRKTTRYVELLVSAMDCKDVSMLQWLGNRIGIPIDMLEDYLRSNGILAIPSYNDPVFLTKLITAGYFSHDRKDQLVKALIDSDAYTSIAELIHSGVADVCTIKRMTPSTGIVSHNMLMTLYNQGYHINVNIKGMFSTYWTYSGSNPYSTTLTFYEFVDVMGIETIRSSIDSWESYDDDTDEFYRKYYQYPESPKTVLRKLQYYGKIKRDVEYNLSRFDSAIDSQYEDHRYKDQMWIDMMLHILNL